MARIRTIKPEFWTHEELSALPEATHILAAALLNYADDHGYFNANPMLVKAACSPLREPSVSIPESFRSLQTIGYIEVGTTPDGKRWGRVMKFDEHQRVSHPTKSKIACLPITWMDSGNSPEILQRTPEVFAPEGNREQGKEQGTGKVAATAPRPPAPVEKREAKTAATWAAYSQAYRARYGTEPVRNAKVNSLLAQVVDRIGSEEAPQVAAFYVQHRAQFYTQRGHAVDCLVADAEKLRTEWATGRQITQTQARQQDKTASNPFLKMVQERERAENQH